MQVCDSDGVRFQYPDDWELTREPSGRDVTFHLQTPGTAFWSLTLLTSRPPAGDAVEAAVLAFREEYPEVDLYDGPELMLEGPAAGCELDFVYMDLVNSAVIRAESTSIFTALVIFQAETKEFETIQAAMDQVTASLKYSGDDDEDEPEKS